MTVRGFRLAHNNQRGITLIELMIAIAIAALITAGIAAATMQVLTINTRASNHMVAVRQVQQAGKEVSKDALQAQPDKIDDDPPGAFLSLNWTNWEGLENEVTYIIEDGELKRSHSINGTPQWTAPFVVAEYIDSAHTSCNWTGSVLIFTVTAAVGTQSETRIYEIDPRVGS